MDRIRVEDYKRAVSFDKGESRAKVREFKTWEGNQKDQCWTNSLNEGSIARSSRPEPANAPQTPRKRLKIWANSLQTRKRACYSGLKEWVYEGPDPRYYKLARRRTTYLRPNALSIRKQRKGKNRKTTRKQKEWRNDLRPALDRNEKLVIWVRINEKAIARRTWFGKKG